MKFGIVGCGTISKFYGEAIRDLQGGEIGGAWDLDGERVLSFTSAYGGRAFASYEEMLGSDVDAVCICLPSGLHAEYAIKAAAAKKHLVVEKPIGITIEQLDAIEKAVNENGVKLCAISQLYFSDGFQAAKKAVDEGRLGKPLLADISMKYYRSEAYYRDGGWRGTLAMDGGGALMNQGIHGVCLMLYLFGPVKSVRAISRTLLHPIEVEDAAVAALEFENGAIGSIVGTTCVTPACPRMMSVHGSKGSITLREDKIYSWELEGEKMPPLSKGALSDSAANPTAFSPELHRRQLEDFMRAVQNDARPTLSLAEGRAPVELILSIYASSRSGKTVYLNEGGTLL